MVETGDREKAMVNEKELIAEKNRPNRIAEKSTQRM